MMDIRPNHRNLSCLWNIGGERLLSGLAVNQQISVFSPREHEAWASIVPQRMVKSRDGHEFLVDQGIDTHSLIR